MASARKESEDRVSVDYQMISVDDHVDLQYLPKDLWSSRLPAHLRARAGHMLKKRIPATCGSAMESAGATGPVERSRARRVHTRTPSNAAASTSRGCCARPLPSFACRT